MLTVILAALLGVVGIVAVLAYVKKANNASVDSGKAVSVLVASGSIPQGTSLNQAVGGNLLVPKTYPKGAVPADAVTAVTHANGKLVTNSAMQPGQLLLSSMLVHRGAVSGAIAVPTGDMAVALEVCLEAAIAGYIQPGARVALFDTYVSSGSIQSTCDSSHQGQPIKAVTTRLVLKNVEVLSVSAAPPPSSETVVSQGVTPVSAGTSAASQGAVFVTLAVNQQEAEQLILDLTGRTAVLRAAHAGLRRQCLTPALNSSLPSPRSRRRALPILCEPAATAGELLAAIDGEVRKADTVGAAAKLLDSDPSETLVVIGPRAMTGEALAFSASLRLARPAVGVILARTQVDVTLLVQALQSGVREVVPAGDHAALAAACRRSYEVSRRMLAPPAARGIHARADRHGVRRQGRLRQDDVGDQHGGRAGQADRPACVRHGP